MPFLPSPLPYRDRKPRGAADFYFAINATFRFIQLNLGREGLIRYWEELGTTYLHPVWQEWRQQGLPAVATYWRAFFAAEPGAEITVEEDPVKVILKVHVCPAINHLRKADRDIVPEFCQHCYFVSDAAARKAGLTARVKGGAGACTQTFYRTEDAPPAQDLTAIQLNQPSGGSGTGIHDQLTGNLK